MGMPAIVRCQRCGALHFAVSLVELAGEALEPYRYCSRCGLRDEFVPSEPRLDELASAIPACLSSEVTRPMPPANKTLD
jgi:hypothetical protein